MTIDVDLLETVLRFAAALSIGLMIGLERGWQEREREEGQRIAGMRTFALLGLLGAVWATLAEHFGVILLGFAFVSLVALITSAYVVRIRSGRDYGITTEVAALITFGLGAMAMRGPVAVAAALAVVTAAVLSAKPLLHRWVHQLERRELYAVVQLLLISVVVLPVLPNRGFGPWEALNPYEIWWMVVLITGISFAGYFAIKAGGARRGLIWTAVLGGLVSSTAVTLSYARLGREQPGLWPVLAMGILFACGTMFLRTLGVAGLLNPDVAAALAPGLVSMALVCYARAYRLWRYRDRMHGLERPILSNPFDIKTALQFGGLLALVMLLAHALRAWLGDAGTYLLAAASGVADVDPVTLTLSRMARGELTSVVAAQGIVIAVLANSLLKAGLVGGIARGRLGADVAATLTVAVALGAVVAFA